MASRSIRLGRFEFNKTAFGFDLAINARQFPHQHFGAWYLRRCDCGFYIFGRHFVWSLS